MPRCLTATYRLQLTRAFPLAEARTLVPYLETLGVSHVYLSPVLAARPRSTHGYDVIDHTRVNPEIGTEDDLRGLADDLHARGMGIVLDIVPNHMAASADNRYWDDVLERGRSSAYADWFDIDWDAPGARGRIVLPVLGDELDAAIDRGDLKLHIRDSGSRIAYFDKTFPLRGATLPRELQLAQLDPSARPAADAWIAGADGRQRLRRLLDDQFYCLTFWRNAETELNYRRFFDINDLVALRMDTDAIFDATHALVLAWVRDGVIDGLRIDHIDGLRLPAWYLARLRERVDELRRGQAADRFPIFVEKILAGDESLPSEWPVQGTTGYDFMNDVEELFLEPAGFGDIEAAYRALRHQPSLSFDGVAREGKRRVLKSALWPDVLRVARIANGWRPDVSADAAAAAIVELIVWLDVYRTYISEPGIATDQDRQRWMEAIESCRRNPDIDPDAVRLIEDALLAAPDAADGVRAELVHRLQQTSGPATAKGVEDTALYVYLPLASRNEVGAKPDRPLQNAAARVHARNLERSRDWPATLLATNTHDTKRSADLRARLDVLASMPEVWARYVSRWRRLNRGKKKIVRGKPSPDGNSEYLYYQTLLGLWPAPRRARRVDDLPSREWLDAARQRMVAYMLKAAREAKTRTSWTEGDPQYEKALDAFVRESLDASDDAPFMGDVARLTAQTAEDGFRFALARVLIQCCAPGVPDVYQGDELWNFTLVDPDNRRPVDFGHRARLLALARSADLLAGAMRGECGFGDERVKLALLARLLNFRRDHAELMTTGEYLPLVPTDGDTGTFAFARRTPTDACIAIARTRVAKEGTSPSVLALPDELAGLWRSELTGRAIDLVRAGSQFTASVYDLLPTTQPCDLLHRAGG